MDVAGLGENFGKKRGVAIEIAGRRALAFVGSRRGRRRRQFVQTNRNRLAEIHRALRADPQDHWQ